MQKEIQEQGYYKPDWDPFVNYDNPIETKTWWGRQLRGLVHFGTLAAGTVLSAKALAASGLGLGISGGAAKLLGANSFIRAAGIGAVSDLISKESDGQNALGALRDRYGWIDTPLSTRDTDHPVVMKVKNIVEGMGIGAVFDATLFKMLPVAKILGQKGVAVGKETATTVADAGVKAGKKLGKAGKEIGSDLRAFRDDMIATDPAELNVAGQKVRDVLDTDLDDLRSRFAEYTQSRRDSVEAQVREEVKEQKKQAGVRFPKNEPIGSRELGNSMSSHSAADVCLLYTSPSPRD